MSRSKHHGCGGTCGLCRPHKKWRSNSHKNKKHSVKVATQDEVDELLKENMEKYALETEILKEMGD